MEIRIVELYGPIYNHKRPWEMTYRGSLGYYVAQMQGERVIRYLSGAVSEAETIKRQKRAELDNG